MSDRLSALLQRFELSTRVFHSGALCGVASFGVGQGIGHLHLRHGTLGVTDAQGQRMVLDAPSVPVFPRPAAHRLDADEAHGAELVCAAVEFGIGDENPLLRALPSQLFVPLARLPGWALPQQVLFAEAFASCRETAGTLQTLTTT